MEKTFKAAGKYKASKIQVVAPETGEISEQTVFCKNYKEYDYDFEKIWVKNFCTVLNEINHKHIQVLSFLLMTKNKDNEIFETQRSISQKLNISLPEINSAMKLFRKSNFIKKMDFGYMINPNVIAIGKNDLRKNLIYKYK